MLGVANLKTGGITFEGRTFFYPNWAPVSP